MFGKLTVFAILAVTSVCTGNAIAAVLAAHTVRTSSTCLLIASSFICYWWQTIWRRRNYLAHHLIQAPRESRHVHPIQDCLACWNPINAIGILWNIEITKMCTNRIFLTLLALLVQLVLLCRPAQACQCHRDSLSHQVGPAVRLQNWNSSISIFVCDKRIKWLILLTWTRRTILFSRTAESGDGFELEGTEKEHRKFIHFNFVSGRQR